MLDQGKSVRSSREELLWTQPKPPFLTCLLQCLGCGGARGVWSEASDGEGETGLVSVFVLLCTTTRTRNYMFILTDNKLS